MIIATKNDADDAVGEGLGSNSNTKRNKDAVMPHQHVISTVALVRCDKIRVINGGARSHAAHERLQLLLQRWLEHARARHRVGEVHGRNVPTVDCDVIGVDLNGGCL